MTALRRAKRDRKRLPWQAPAVDVALVRNLGPVKLHGNVFDAPPAG